MFPKTKDIILNNHSVTIKIRKPNSDRLLLPYPQPVFLSHRVPSHRALRPAPSPHPRARAPARLTEGTQASHWAPFFTETPRGVALTLPGVGGEMLGNEVGVAGYPIRSGISYHMFQFLSLVSANTVTLSASCWPSVGPLAFLEGPLWLCS